jgi:predicted ArsR family transcriptional regulator
VGSKEQSAAEPAEPLDSLGLLAEPNRRALYDFVVARHDWVGREQAAEGVGLARGITGHHLDRLAEGGLLDVDYRRLTGRRGPGAGRTAKVYRRAPTEVAVNLPPRHYELAAHLLARAAERARQDGTPFDLAVDQAARATGRSMGVGVGRPVGRRSLDARRTALVQALGEHGFEPETVDAGVVVLHNCPFHRLARSHTELICNMNLSLLEGMLSELEDTGLRAELDPVEGACCVRLRPDAGGGEG